MMKKLLYTLLVFAVGLMPAVAENALVAVYADLFSPSVGSYDTNQNCYRFVVIKQENTNVNSLAETIALQSLASFTATYGPSFGADRTITQDNWNQVHGAANLAWLDRTTPKDNVYAVSIYQGEAAVGPMFQVISCNATLTQQGGFNFDTKDERTPSQFTAYRAFTAPEPAATALCLLAAAGLAARRRRC